MHMADALVAPAVATTMYLCSAAAGGYSVRQVRALNEPKKVPVMGAYNEEHGITPTTIQKSVRELISVSKKVAKEEMNFKKAPESMNRDELTKLIADIQKKMQKAAADLNFEAAAEYRDKMVELKGMLRDM